MKKIAICNLKGGTGKTTFCICLGGALAERGKNVMMVDMDPQASMTSSFLVNSHNIPCVTDVLIDDQKPMKDVVLKTSFENIYIVQSGPGLGKMETVFSRQRDAHHYLKDKLQEIEAEYDIILMDTPPSDGLETWSVLTAAEGVIIPLEAQDYSVKGTGYVHGVIQKVRKRANPQLTILGYVINRYDGRRKIEQDFRSMIERHLGERVFRQVVKDLVVYVEAVTAGKPITYFAPESEEAEVFRQIEKEILSV